MRINGKRTAAVGGVIAALALGGTGVALAQSSPTTAAQSAQSSAAAAPGQNDNTQDPSYTGSIPAPTDTGNAASEADESASLQGLATISPEQATSAALAAVAGTAGPAQLGNENGFVVYSVEVTGADGTITDVKVDAGTGQVLAQDSGEAAETGGSEGSGTPEGAQG